MSRIIDRIDRFRENRSSWSKGKRDVVAIVVSFLVILAYALATLLITAIIGTELYVSAILTLVALMTFISVDMAIYAFMFS